MFAVCVDLGGLLLFSTFISSITATMTQLRQVSSSNLQDMKQVKTFFQNNSISVRLGCRIMSFLRASRAQPLLLRTSADTVKALRALPDDLRQELDIEVYQRILLAHPLFGAVQAFEMDALCQIVSSGLKEKPLLEDEVLFRKFGPAEYMWFIVFGQMSYQRDSSTCALEVGTWVSEAALWVDGWYHRGDLQAVKQSNVVGLEAGRAVACLTDSSQEQRAELVALIGRYAVRFLSEYVSYGESPFTCTDLWSDSAFLEGILRDLIREVSAGSPGSPQVDAWHRMRRSLAGGD